MIQVGQIYSLKDATPVGTATITRRETSDTYDFFWAIVNWPGYKYSGRELPFSKKGAYYGSQAWKVPDLNMDTVDEPL